MIESAGGGGYGDPREREPELVVRDVLDGFVTPDAAERVYGIAVVDGALDAERTRAARAGR
jgi:N-methylhydantoinase B